VRLPDLLVSEGLVNPDTVVEVFEAQALYGGSFDTNLLELGVLDERRLVPYLERAYGVANRVDVFGEPTVEALQKLPRERAEALKVCPFRLSGRMLDVVCVDPSDVRALDEIAMLSGARVQPSVAIEARVALHLYRGYGTPMPNRLVSVLRGGPGPSRWCRAARARGRSPRAADQPRSARPRPTSTSRRRRSSPPARRRRGVQAPDESATDQVLRFDVAELRPPVSTLPLSETDLGERLSASRRARPDPAARPRLSGRAAARSSCSARARPTSPAGTPAVSASCARRRSAWPSRSTSRRSSPASPPTSPRTRARCHTARSRTSSSPGNGRPLARARHRGPVRVKGRVVSILYVEPGTVPGRPRDGPARHPAHRRDPGCG
jgi:hypothetical protein